MHRTSPILLYDGSCGFCARSVQWVLAHEGSRRDLRFVSLEGPRAASLRERYPDLARTDSLIWHEEGAAGASGQVLVRSEAVLAVLRYVGRGWALLASVAHLIPRRLRDAAYDLVAKHRHGLAGAEACVVPTPEQRARFPELGR